MRILRLEAENVKRLKVIDIKPDGSLVQITGDNGAGKTSVLDCIWWAVDGGGHVQDEPIRKGQETARIKLDLGELVVERRFTAKNRTGALSVGAVTDDGIAKYASPQKMLDALVSALTFDPLEFARSSAKDQYDMLLGAIGDANIDIPQLDALNAGAFDQRRDVNRRIRENKARLDAMPEVPDNVPDEELSPSTLLQEVQEAGTKNQARLAEIARREGRDAMIKHREAQIKEHQDAINLLVDNQNADTDLPAEIDTAPILAKIESVEVVNRAVAAKRTRGQVELAISTDEAAALALSESIDKRNAKKLDAIANSELPVEGLTIGDGVVLLKGLPFDQASDAERLQASTAIAMAANPKLRVLRIRDGSLLDSKALEALGEMAKAQDYQIWIERVGTGPVGIVLEDGMVAMIDGKKVEQPEAAPADVIHPASNEGGKSIIPPSEPTETLL